MSTITYSVLSQFLFVEAALLDAQDWDGWERLFIPDGIYWVPAAHGQTDPINHVSLVYENALLRAIRLRRLRASDASSLQVKLNSSHLISNIAVAHANEAAGLYTLESRFVVAQYTDWGKTVFHGGYTHELLAQDGGLRISRKRVDLVDVEGPQGDLLIIL